MAGTRRRLLALLGLQALLRGGPARAAPDATTDAAADAAADAKPGAELAPPPAPPWRVRALVTSDGVRLNLLEQSPVDAGLEARAPAPTIVLLPGWCMPATIWRAQLGALGARWTTVAMDPRGQGESAIPAGGYTADRRADDLHDVLQGYERVVLVAWSLGVLEALQYVQRHGSGRLLGLALVDNSIGEPPAPRGSDFLARLRRDRRATVDGFVRSLFAHPPPAAQLDALRESALRMPLESSIALLSYPLPREHWRDIVHAFDRPLAYLVTPRYREQSRHLLEARPSSRVEIFENAGHALFVDEPARFNAFMFDWIEALAQGA
jgi:microsomal epoxide hydrolase